MTMEVEGKREREEDRKTEGKTAAMKLSVIIVITVIKIKRICSLPVATVNHHSSNCYNLLELPILILTIQLCEKLKWQVYDTFVI